MQFSNKPNKIKLPFANSGGKTSIPVTSQIGVTAGAASYADGFPPLTRTPKASGGIPPKGVEVNGVLYELSAVIRWANLGAGFDYDSSFASDSNIGGYPKGARILRSDATGYWLNTVDNNTTDPESAGAAAAGWVPDLQAGATAITMTGSSVTLTPLQYGRSVIVITGTITANLNLIFPDGLVGEWSVLNATTGAFTITAKTVSGTGIVVTQGQATSIVSNGTNILLNKNETCKTVKNIAELKSVKKTDCLSVETLGYYVSGDGGDGRYWIDLTDTTSVDNGGSVIVASDGGRWKLINSNATPKQFGCKGDGSAVDTAEFNKWVDWVNSSGLQEVSLDSGLVYLVGPISSFTTPVTIRGNGSTLKSLADSWLTSGDGTTFLRTLGYGTRLFDLTIDGNKSSFTAAPAGRLWGFGKGVSAYNVTIKNSPQQGVRHDAGTDATILQTSGEFENLQILDCAGTGLELAFAQFMKFSKMRILRCGYGYGNTRPTPADTSALTTTGFGMVVRYRSHDLDFVGCDFLDNGRDGAGVGQGSYNVKFIGCAANRNGDGGFTLFNDVVSPGRPGDGEVPSNIDYIGCTASTNYGSGLASYCPTHNITVCAGKFYNNHVLAGDIPFESSHYSGLYFASGSTGLNINTQAYDNRQIRAIGAVSGSGSTRVITASGWVSGSKDYAPKVSFYDSTLTWQGYGKIVAESTGGVTVSATTYDPVNLASIASGWYITQATQHNGCFFDNNVIAKVKIDGFGHRGGPSGFNLSGRDVSSGSFASGQNVRVYGDLNTTELVANPSFEVDLSNWVFSVPGGGSATRDTGTIRKSVAALKLVGGSSAAQGDATLTGSAIEFADGQFIELNVDVYADRPNDCYVQLFYGPVPFDTAVWHPGGSKWKRLTIGAYIPTNSAYLIIRLVSQAGKTCYFDNVSMRVLDEGRDYRDVAFYSNNLPY